MDAGSSLVWIQCEGCAKCFKQTQKPSPKRNSSSFHPLLTRHRPSYYERKYADGATTQGILARETFYLRSNTGGSAKVENLEFGCGLHNDMQYGKYRNNEIAGMTGLGSEDLSFVNQLGPLIKGKFSHCLPLLSGKTPNTYLTFGDDKMQLRKARSTPLYTKNETSANFVQLQGISLKKTRLNIDPKVFASKNNASSEGCVIDSGTSFSRIISPAFDVLKHELEKHSSKFNDLKKIKGDLGLELCYERNKPQGFDKPPGVTFHFRGSHADFAMKAEAVFEVSDRFRNGVSRQYFCLAMSRDSQMSIFGNHQQTNHRIVRDTMNKRPLFYPEDCSKNP